MTTGVAADGRELRLECPRCGALLCSGLLYGQMLLPCHACRVLFLATRVAVERGVDEIVGVVEANPAYHLLSDGRVYTNRPGAAWGAPDTGAADLEPA